MRLKNILTAVLAIILVVSTAYSGYRLAFRGLIFPKITVAGVNVGGMDKISALKLVNSYFVETPTKIVLEMEGKEIMGLNGLKTEQDLVWAIDQALGVGRNGNILTQITEQISVLFEGRSVGVPISYDKDELKDTVDQVVDNLNRKPKLPKLIRNGGEIQFITGTKGMEVRTDDLIQQIITNLALPGEHKVEVPLSVVNTQEDIELVNKARIALEKWGDRGLRLKFRDFEESLDQEQMLSLWGLIDEPINSDVYNSLLEKIRPAVETEPKDAVFVFEEGKVKEFKQEVVGATIDVPTLRNKLAEYLLAAEDKLLEVPMILTYPKIKTGDINNMGIKELIGTGNSTFFHSIPGRVFNVNLAASRISGVVVAPGEEFSFANSVGDISKATGYQTAYVISGGRTVLGDGGGVCQVSTTVFRAALNAGLPITERKAHAYRVGYYEQDSGPGIDATVFSPSVDLKFLNDTGHHILVQTTVDTKNLKMKVEIYGTSDGRRATIGKPKISSQTPPPPTIYTDDPTLPKGTLKQIDWSAWGAKVSFDYKVIDKDGATMIEKTFFSNYQPWRAVYLRGTGN